jgi:hypothetical protein
MAEICAELSDDPPLIAIQGVVLELPADIVAYLNSRGVVQYRNDYAYFQYTKDLKIPIQIKA